jgi:hypothetical protein
MVLEMKCFTRIVWIFVIGQLLTIFAYSDTLPVPQGYYGVPAKNLAITKQRLAAHDPSVSAAFGQLIEKANTALLDRPPSVMDKAKCAASGDKHDFFSFAPYWWPNPKRPDGLPYIRRDGHVFPQSKIGTDSVAFANMSANVEILAMAYYLSGKDAYAEKAAEFVRVWFLNPRTAMNANANYGQAIPGVIDGRAEGIIEMRHLTRITDAIALISSSGYWKDADRKLMDVWLRKYCDWLETNTLPIDDTSTRNNHLTWREVQLVQFFLVLGEPARAQTLLQSERQHLLAVQVDPNGEQSLELVRTNSLGYSLFNLEALFRLATLGEYVGIDFFAYATTDRRSLYAALDSLAPYVDAGKPWPKPEIRAAQRWRLLPLLIQAYTHNKMGIYRDEIGQFYGSMPDLPKLLWPRPESDAY